MFKSEIYYTYERLNQAFIYDPKTGLIRWKFTDGKHKAKRGALAGCIRGDGYIKLTLDNHGIFGHVAAWVLYYGTWPRGIIDHINRNPGDNRIANLREATQKDNLRNSLGRRNHLLPKGVSLTADGTYAARIRDGTKHRWLGAYRTIAEAEAAYRKASLTMHGKFSIYS